MAYNWNENPLRNVKVELPTDFDAQRVIYRMIHGTDLGYTPHRGETLKERQAREKQRSNF